MYNVQDHSRLYDNAVHLVLCESCHCTRTWKTLTQDKEKQSKNTTQYVLDTTISKQTQIT
jgi:hypothetical protein